MVTILKVAKFPTDVQGRWLAHNNEPLAVRAFVAGVDLVGGDKRLVKPTMTQAAYLARVSPAAAWAAHKRRDERAAIEAGFVSLFGPRPKKTVNGNGAGHVDLANVEDIDDETLLKIARLAGPARMVDAAIAIEAA